MGNKIKIDKPLEDTWWVIKSTDDSIIHYGLVTPGNLVESGLDKIKTYKDEVKWANHLLLFNMIITGETSENIYYSGTTSGGTWVNV